MKGKPSLVLLSNVSRMEAARMALTAFEEANARVVEQHERLKEEYNSSVKEVGDLYKREYENIGSTFGQFKITERIAIDGKKLLELLPAADMLVTIEYSVDRKEFNKLVKEGGIPQSIVSEVEYVASVAVTGPKKA